MAMRNPIRMYFLLLGGAFLLVSVGNLGKFYRERRDIWWTPEAMMVRMEDSHERVEVYVRGLRLTDVVSAGRLSISGETDAAPVKPSEIGFRFNNFDRVRAMRIPALLGSTAAAGAAGALVILGSFGLVPAPRRPDREGGPSVS